MRRRMAISLAMLSMLVILTVTIASPAAAAPPYVSGLSTGVTADYSVVGNPPLTYSKTHVQIWGIYGSYVALVATNIKSNGAIDSSNYANWSVDSYGGASYNLAVFYWAVGKDFANGDNVLPDTAFGVYVTDSLTMIVAGVARPVLHATGGGLVVTYFDMYFDKATGLVVKGDFALPTGWVNETLTSTTAFASAPFDFTIVALIEGVSIIALVVGLVLLIRRGKSSRRR
ncbi:MAG: hypothetical protein WED05_11740 [Candidatus Atabeyarchaeum deiterrae]